MRPNSGCRTKMSAALENSAKAKGVKHGVVQDKLFLPGLQKLRMLRDSGFFGRMLSRSRTHANIGTFVPRGTIMT